MTKATATRRPSITMLEDEADKLTNLALSMEARLPQVSELLLAEVSRATIKARGKMPADVVTMGSTITYEDASGGAQRTVTLVYPQEANIDAGKISILTPIGAGLIGLKTGQSIMWPDREGNTRPLTIINVMQPALQEG